MSVDKKQIADLVKAKFESIASAGALWTLQEKNRLVLSTGNDGDVFVPLWSSKENAERCKTLWPKASAVKVSIVEWFDVLAEAIQASGHDIDLDPFPGAVVRIILTVDAVNDSVAAGVVGNPPTD